MNIKLPPVLRAQTTMDAVELRFQAIGKAARPHDLAILDKVIKRLVAATARLCSADTWHADVIAGHYDQHTHQAAGSALAKARLEYTAARLAYLDLFDLVAA